MIKKYSWLNKTFDSLGKDRVTHGKRNFRRNGHLVG